jgi:FAD/FMN-containing dehydrogenase
VKKKQIYIESLLKKKTGESAGHRQKVERVAGQVKTFLATGNRISIQKASLSHMVNSLGKRKNEAAKINIRDFVNILSIDPERRICIAESGVTFSKLVRETLKYNLVPKCVPEIKSITLGGTVSGCSVESMSFKHGGFYDSCLEFEIVTGRGDILTCSRGEDTFEMLHASFGTLGIITTIAFELVPAKPYVRLDFHKYDSMAGFQDAMVDHFTGQDIDFMDGIVHSPAQFVLCTGNFVDNAPYTGTSYWTPYYKSTLKRRQDYLRTYDYFFRYDRDGFWVSGKYGMENKLLRLLLGPFVLGFDNMLNLAEILFFLTNRTGKPYVIVDVLIPFTKSRDFYEWYEKEFNYFPLWVVPYRHDPYYKWVNPGFFRGLTDNLFIDFAIYAFKQPRDGRNYYRLLEEKVKELQGVKILISHNFYREEEFWEIHNKALYDKVKAQIDPHNLFRNLYTKLC